MSMMHEITSGLRLKKQKRKGRGESSGKGKTCGRGTKGAGAHGGDVAWKPGHEGGQTPLHRRLPKRGFSNDPFERPYYLINLGQLDKFDAGSTVDLKVLIASRLLDDEKLPVKILGDGTFTKKLIIQADRYSKSALAKIAELGGQALNAKGEKFELSKPKKKFVKREPAKKIKPADGPTAAGEAPSAETPKVE